MSRAAFTIVYDGSALRDHAMDVRDLAPAILGLGQLFDAANTALNGDTRRIKVQVQATEPGSFRIVFDVVQTFGENLIALFSGPEVTAAANLVSLIVGVGVPGGLLWLIQRTRGRAPQKVEKLPDNNVRLTIGDDTIDVPIELLRLFQDVAVRTAAQKVVEEPLKQDGIDSFEVRDGGRSVFRVEKGEAVYFARPQLPDETLIDEVRRSAFSIISLAFKEDNKWRLNDGTNAISATIEDASFLQKVDTNQVSFSKGDILICDVRVIQRRTDDGLKTEYKVIRVAEHRPAVRQLPLPFDSRRPPEGDSERQPFAPPEDAA
jgi:hypothetical protein